MLLLGTKNKKQTNKQIINKAKQYIYIYIYIYIKEYFYFLYSNLPTVLNSFGLHWQYWVAKASIIRSIFWASPGKRKLQRKSLIWSRKLLNKAEGKPFTKYFILAHQSLTKLKLLDPFHVTGFFLYPLKASENLLK